MLGRIFALALAAPLLLAVGAGAAAREVARSTPPDTTRYTRPILPEDLPPPGKLPLRALPPPFSALEIVDTVVDNTDPTLERRDAFSDSEPGIAIDPRHPRHIVVTAFSGSWGANAPLWFSTDGGRLWTKQETIPAPPVARFQEDACPCDQTVDFDPQGRLAGTFLVDHTQASNDVYSGVTTNPANAAGWAWFMPNGLVQKTNHHNPASRGDVDQPWLIVNPIPGAASGKAHVYVAYDDFSTLKSGGPDMRVAVAPARDPLNFLLDRRTGAANTHGKVNPGHRLAGDARRGFVYSLYQRRIGPGTGGSQRIAYMLNLSVDGGRSWSLDGSPTGIAVATADSTQPFPKFGTVNALLGGVLHAAVDPASGNVLYVYGARDAATGKNRLAIRRIVVLAGHAVIGPEVFVTGRIDAALPSVAVAENGIIGVFYYSFDGFSADGFPRFTAHLAASSDGGMTFGDLVLLTFLSAAKDNDKARQRVLGDYVQMKALGNAFYGAFTANGAAFGRQIADDDAVFFRAAVR
jgi:hypothetical protein